MVLEGNVAYEKEEEDREGVHYGRTVAAGAFFAWASALELVLALVLEFVRVCVKGPFADGIVVAVAVAVDVDVDVVAEQEC